MTSAVPEMAERMNARGLKIRPQVGARPASVLMSLEGTLNPMRQFPAYSEIKSLPIAEQRERLLDPDFRARVLADVPKVPRFEDTARQEAPRSGCCALGRRRQRPRH